MRKEKTEIGKSVSIEINCGHNDLKFAINKSYLWKMSDRYSMAKY